MHLRPPTSRWRLWTSLQGHCCLSFAASASPPWTGISKAGFWAALTHRVPLSSAGYFQAFSINLAQTESPWAATAHHRGNKGICLRERGRAGQGWSSVSSPALISAAHFIPHCSLFRSSSGQNHLISFIPDPLCVF